MELTNSFFEFARDYVGRYPELDENFEAPPKMLDDFQFFLSQRRIRPDLSEWSSTLDYIRSRLKQEFFNLRFGVAKGDEVEASRQPEVIEALRVLESAR
jgi:hypothetical protein